jgi:hypothetical protein
MASSSPPASSSSTTALFVQRFRSAPPLPRQARSHVQPQGEFWWRRSSLPSTPPRHEQGGRECDTDDPEDVTVTIVQSAPEVEVESEAEDLPSYPVFAHGSCAPVLSMPESNPAPGIMQESADGNLGAADDVIEQMRVKYERVLVEIGADSAGQPSADPEDSDAVIRRLRAKLGLEEPQQSHRKPADLVDLRRAPDELLKWAFEEAPGHQLPAADQTIGVSCGIGEGISSKLTDSISSMETPEQLVIMALREEDGAGDDALLVQPRSESPPRTFREDEEVVVDDTSAVVNNHLVIHEGAAGKKNVAPSTAGDALELGDQRRCGSCPDQERNLVAGEDSDGKDLLDCHEFDADPIVSLLRLRLSQLEQKIFEGCE